MLGCIQPSRPLCRQRSPAYTTPVEAAGNKVDCDLTHPAFYRVANIRAESAERERDEWKRIARRYRNSLNDSNPNAIRVCHSELSNTCKAYDALVKGE
jgi:hypothetical protein